MAADLNDPPPPDSRVIYRLRPFEMVGYTRDGRQCIISQSNPPFVVNHDGSHTDIENKDVIPDMLCFADALLSP